MFKGWEREKVEEKHYLIHSVALGIKILNCPEGGYIAPLVELV